MAHVFISYAHEDGDFAEVLTSKLKEEGISHWVDSEHLRAGEDWRQAIDDAIRSAFAVIVVMSPIAKTSEYVTYEWAFAWGLGVRVVPILYTPTALHPRLEALQFLDFTSRSQRPWDKLVEHLKLLETGYVPPAQPKARLDAGTLKLMEDLASNNPPTRRKAIDALGNIGERSAVPKLIEILQSDGSWAVRQDAILALVKLGDGAANRSFIRALHADTSIHVRTAAAWALGEFKSQEAVESLIEVLERFGYKEQNIKRAAAVALRKIGNKSVAPRLVKLLQVSEIAVTARIIEALGYFKETTAVEQIESYLNNTKTVYINDDTYSLDQVAFDALERIGTPEAGAAIENWREQQKYK